MFDFSVTPYTDDLSLFGFPKTGNRKPRMGVLCACAVCKKSRVTLLKREGDYFCKPCWERITNLREQER